jgi:hypothetical protein
MILRLTRQILQSKWAVFDEKFNVVKRKIIVFYRQRPLPQQV